jgi:hypothetical protein
VLFPTKFKCLSKRREICFGVGCNCRRVGACGSDQSSNVYVFWRLMSRPNVFPSIDTPCVVVLASTSILCSWLASRAKNTRRWESKEKHEIPWQRMIICMISCSCDTFINHRFIFNIGLSFYTPSGTLVQSIINNDGRRYDTNC